MTHTAQLLPTGDKEYQLINGRCRDDDCDRWATCQLIDHEERAVPGCKYCAACAQERIDEYAEKLNWHWTARPLQLYRAAHVLFASRQHAEEYAAQKNEEQQQ